jgi:hypothetical protein
MTPSERKRLKEVERHSLKGDLLPEVLGRIVGNLRAEIHATANVLRAELGLPPAKPRVRVPADSSLMRMGNTEYQRAITEKRRVRVPCGRGQSW